MSKTVYTLKSAIVAMACLWGVTAQAQSISLYPPSASMRITWNQQFTASTSGLNPSTVNWSVNGIAGGNSTVGTVSSSGYFNAPNSIALGTVTVKATSTVNSSVSGSAVVTLWNPSVALISISPTQVNQGNFNLTVTGVGFVPGTTATFAGSPISVTYVSSSQLKVSGNTSAPLGTNQPLTVSNPNPGPTTNTLNYPMAAPITVTSVPGTASLTPGVTQVFHGTVHNSSNIAMNWYVNGILGGNSSFGTISTTGATPTYTAPASITSTSTVNVQAQSAQDATAWSANSVVTLSPPTVTVSPSTATPRVLFTQQFTSAVTGLSSSSVNWAVNGVASGNSTFGTITSGGFYTAPATLPGGAVTVQAISAVNSGVSGTAAVTVWNPAPALISISPSNVNTGNFNFNITGIGFVPGITATFAGSTLAVTYLSSTQLHVSGSTTAPAGSSKPLTVTNPNPGSSSNTLNYSVIPPITVTSMPATANLSPGATQNFSGTVYNCSNITMNWYVNGILGGNSSVGTITLSGATATYTAPAVAPSPNTVNIQAQSAQDTTIWSPASVVTLIPSAVTVSPSIATPRVLLTQQFSASTVGLSSSSVNWSVNGVAGGNATFGTIDGAGLYSAPATVPSGGVTVVATSAVSSSATGSASVTVWNPAPAIISISPSSVNTGNFNFNITGMGFLPTTTATFAGSPLTVSYISPTQVHVTGSTSAAAGSSQPLTVTNPNPGSASNTLNYFVVPPITLTSMPATASVRPGATQTFAGTVYNCANIAMNWFVNGIAGGNSEIGTITLTGSTATYTAPATPPNPNTVNIQAQSAQDTTIWSPASVVTVLSPLPVITALTPTTLHFGPITVNLTGAGFVPGSQVMLGSTALNTQFVSTSQLTATGTATPVVGGIAAITISNPNPGAAVSNWVSVGIQEGAALVGYQTAFHFLEQATWGPTPQDVDHLQQVGFTQWYNEQLAAPVSVYTPNPVDLSQPMSDFYYNALTGQDQLRQRVAFALAQIFCVSGNKNTQPNQIIPYFQLLEADATGNFYNLLNDVTLSPQMGFFLDMVNNVKGTGPALANENYAREVMQLFDIGVNLLNMDGSLQLDGSGNPIPTYTQTTVENLARVFTGWTYPTQPGLSAQPLNPSYYTGQMVAWEANHDTSSKALLNGYVVPANQSSAQDVQSALQNIFNHPNLAPFISKLLIQHLVSSNPSPAYIQRVAQVFTDNGSGTRGDLWAVTQAILNDSEARQSDSPSTWIATGGHLREPVLYLTALLRNLNTNVTASTTSLATIGSTMGQQIWFPLSVFGYYLPSNLIPGSTTLLGPEFQTLYSSSALARVNYSYLIETNVAGPGLQTSLAPFQVFANAPSTLVQAMSNAFMAGQMPAQMQSIISTAIKATTNAATRVQNAFYLTVTSPYYQSQR